MKNLVYLSLTGLFLGWMIGMSNSPVISGVISSLLTAIVAGASIIGKIGTDIGNFKSIKDLRVDLKPFMILIIFLSVGASIGIITRTSNILDFSRHDNFESEITNQIKLFTSFGLDSTEAARIILESKYQRREMTFDNKSSDYMGALYTWFTANEC